MRHTKTRSNTVVWAVLPLSQGYAREIARGLGQGLRLAGAVMRIADTSTTDVPDVKGDGYITLGASERILEYLSAGRPVVNVSSRSRDLYDMFPSVVPDNREAGRLAAEHLQNRGYANFAATPRSFHYARERYEGFVHACQPAHVHLYHPPSAKGRSAWAANQAALGEWLVGLPKPVGILLPDDQAAQGILQRCEDLHLGVPHEIGVVGVNNDDLFCQAQSPPLTSVDLNAQRIGTEAAALVLALVGGAAPPEEPAVVPVRGVVERESTGAVVAEDPLVREALERMNADLSALSTVDHLAKQLGVSKRTLERAFDRTMGRSPAVVWRRLRLDRAAHLLRETNHPLKEIAAASGFASFPHFCRRFRREYDASPTEYRNARRLG